MILKKKASFSVDETRGIIRVAKDLTQQLSPIVAFNVTAFDGHSRASTNVSITITYQSSISDQKNRKYSHFAVNNRTNQLRR